jgi:hypothetical protein|tara:strand:+ start:446 stop:613 length:168 start_codon:yes stop_codon:yes gene_type:complete
MNRSNKGFGLTGVIVTVIFLIVAAIFSASAKSSTISLLHSNTVLEPVTNCNFQSK